MDPELGEIDTPNGHLVFLEAEAVTRDEMEALMCWDGKNFLELAEPFIPLGITDLARTSLMEREDFAAAWRAGVEEDGSSGPDSSTRTSWMPERAEERVSCVWRSPMRDGGSYVEGPGGKREDPFIWRAGT